MFCINTIFKNDYCLVSLTVFLKTVSQSMIKWSNEMTGRLVNKEVGVAFKRAI